MKDNFSPPINERDTNELLEIVGSYEKWNPKAVNQAVDELKKRKVSKDQFDFARYIENKKDKIEKLRKSKEGYDLIDYFSGLIWLEILFSWELKKDGYFRKAKQQKRIRLSLLAVFILIIILVIIKE